MCTNLKKGKAFRSPHFVVPYWAVAPVKHLLIAAIFWVTFSSKVALASCGDYLHHFGADLLPLRNSKLLALHQLPLPARDLSRSNRYLPPIESPAPKCMDGRCQNRDGGAPFRIVVRIDPSQALRGYRQDFLAPEHSGQECALDVELTSQFIGDVSTPPPRYLSA